MNSLSDLAFRKYRSLVERPDFVSYFHAATPIDQIDQLNLGSRPARRKKTEVISDLRAIPWVFAWTQSRTNIPSWYGVGTALEQWIGQGDEDPNARIEELKSMFEEWPFFRTIMGNVHLGMGRADMNIAQLYSELAGDNPGVPVFSDIEAEFKTTRKQILQVTGKNEILDSEPWLQHSIRMRNPYVDPMNYVQVALLNRLQANPDDPTNPETHELLLQSISGIAAGLQNVG